MKPGYLLAGALSLGCNALGGSSLASLDAELRRLRASQEQQSAQIEQLQNRVLRGEAAALRARSDTESTTVRPVIRLGAEALRAEPIRIDSTERPELPEDPSQEPPARITAARGDRIPEGTGFVVHESDRLPVVPLGPAPSVYPLAPSLRGGAPTPLPRAQGTAPTAGRNERVLPPMGTLDPGALRAYENALARAREGRCREAIGEFSDFVSRYPEHPHADNALYWRAECVLRGGDRQGALADFEELLRRYPMGNKVSDALYKVAVIQRDLGAPAASELAAQRLLNDFPDSDAARRMRVER